MCIRDISDVSSMLSIRLFVLSFKCRYVLLWLIVSI